MALTIWTKRAALAASVMALSSAAFADATNGDVQSELQALKARINELEAKQNENWLTEERASQIKGLVQEVIADAKTRGQFADGDVQAGYKDGFFIQSADKNYKLTVGGYAQVRYTYGLHQSKSQSGSSSWGDGDRYNSSGFEVRGARIAFSGNVVNPDITYKIELVADRGQSVTYSDAFIGYRINDLFKIRAGSYKVPFAKSQLTSDTAQGLINRPEVLAPFDASRQIGVSLYGDIIKDTLGYEVMISNGNGNTGLTDSSTASYDNRPGFYGRMQWAGAGAIKDFSDESDLRKDNSNFIWMLGGAAGYESFDNGASNNPPGRQSTATGGWGTNEGANGFTSLAGATGDVFRGTVDWSAKWQGWSFLTAGYIQQVNMSRDNPTTLYDSSGFEYGAYGQVGYFIMPRTVEVIGRVGTFSSEGSTDSSQYYTIGANYYIAGHNAKITGDLTWVPSEAFASDSNSYQVQNNEAFIARVQLQIKF